MSEHKDEPTPEVPLDRTDLPTQEPEPDGLSGADSPDPVIAAAYDREPDEPDATESDPTDGDSLTFEPDDQGEAIQLYWEAVRAKARIGRLSVYMGTDLAAAVPPPAWSFGDNPRLADELLGHVLSGRKTGTSTALAEFGDEPLPREGELSIILDSGGNPRALVRTAAVATVRFDEVDEAFAASEGEDDLSLGSWREQHEVYWRRVLGDDAFDPSMQVVTERFELIDPHPGR